MNKIRLHSSGVREGKHPSNRKIHTKSTILIIKTRKHHIGRAEVPIWNEIKQSRGGIQEIKLGSTHNITQHRLRRVILIARQNLVKSWLVCDGWVQDQEILETGIKVGQDADLVSMSRSDMAKMHLKRMRF